MVVQLVPSTSITHLRSKSEQLAIVFSSREANSSLLQPVLRKLLWRSVLHLSSYSALENWHLALWCPLSFTSSGTKLCPHQWCHPKRCSTQLHTVFFTWFTGRNNIELLAVFFLVVKSTMWSIAFFFFGGVGGIGVWTQGLVWGSYATIESNPQPFFTLVTFWIGSCTFYSELPLNCDLSTYG
jgi:hypothetical protein